MTAAARERLVIDERLMRRALRVHVDMTTVGDGDLPIAQSTWDEQTIIASFIRWLREARAAEAVRSRRAALRVIEGTSR